MNTALVPAGDVPRCWPKVRQLLSPAVRRSEGRYTEDTILKALLAGEMHLWVIFEKGSMKCAILTSFVIYPAMKTLSVLFLGGMGRRNWLAGASETLMSFGRDNGVEKIEMLGRPGWVKDAAKLGYSSPAIFFERDL